MKKLILAILIITVLLVLSFFGESHFRRRNAITTVQKILNYWENGDLIPAISYWEVAAASPPVYDLFAYEIGHSEFDKLDGFHRARVFVTLYFPVDNPSPSGREWLFTLKKTRHGWKVTSFRLKE